MTSNTKRLSINLISSIIGTVVGLGVAFFLTPYLVGTIGKDVYAFFPMANNFVSYFTIIVTAFNALAARFITVNLVSGDVEQSKEYYSSVFFANLILAAIFIIPIIIIIIFLERFLHIPEQYVEQIKVLFSLVFLSFIINLITSVFGAAVFVKDRIDLKSYQHIITYVIRVLGYIGLFALFEPNIIFVGVVTVSESIANAAMSLYFTKKLLPDYKIKVSYIRAAAIKSLVSSGIWNSINSLGTNLLSGMMIVLANMLISAEASGTISLTMTLVNLCTTIISMVVNVFYPRMTREYAKNGITGLAKETTLSQYILSFVTATPIVILIVLGKEFFSLWVPEENAQQLFVISSICLLPYVVQANTWTLSQVFPVINNLKTPAIINLVFGGITVILTIIVSKIANGIVVIPIVSTIFNVIYSAVFLPVYVSRCLDIKIIMCLKPFLRGIVANILTMVVCFLLKDKFRVYNWLNFALVAGLFCIIGFVFSWAFCGIPVMKSRLLKGVN